MIPPNQLDLASTRVNYRAVDTSPLVERIETAISEIPGWTPIDQLHTIYTLGLATAALPGDFIEIGSWCGRSAVVMGMAATFIGGTKVHCIDLFPEREDWHRYPNGDYYLEVKIGEGVHRAFDQHRMWPEVFEKQVVGIYETYGGPLACFRRQIDRLNLNGTVCIHRGTSATFAAALDPAFRCKLAFVDGDHDYEAVCRDIHFLKERLVPGGWICFDDAFSSYEGVETAIRALILSDPDFDLAQQMTRKLFVARKRIARS